MEQVLKIKLTSLKRNIDIIKNGLEQIEKQSIYAYFNEETRLMIKDYKKAEKDDIF